MKTAQQWHQEGLDLVKQRKLADASKCFDEAIALDPKLTEAYNKKCEILFNGGRFSEVVPVCDKALQANPTDRLALYNKGRALYSDKKYAEGLQWLNKTIEQNPDWAPPYNTKGNLFRMQDNYDEAIAQFKKTIELFPNFVYTYRNLALCYEDKKDWGEAIKYIDQAIEKDPGNVQYLIDKGGYFKQLGKRKEALETFRKANKLLQEGFFNIDLIPSHMEWIKTALGSLDELEKAEAEAEASIKKADQSNPVVKKMVDRLINLQKEKEKVTNNVVDKMGSNNAGSDKTLTDEVQKLKDEFLKVQQQLANVQAEVKDIKNEMQDVKEELANKMDDFDKKLDNELNKKDLSPENKAKLKEYFKAFIGTFSSIYVTSQVIDSGQVKLNSDSAKATILSMIASFTPFVGSILQSGIKNLGDFLQSKEMKTNARKMKRIAHDSSSLSQTVGSAAYEIVLHQQKQEQILTITSEDLKKRSNALLSKIEQFCEDIQLKIDSYLYSELYSSPAARLGHNDANRLVEDFINDKIDSFEVSKQFVKEATNLQKLEQPEDNPTATITRNRSACCNMF